MRDDDIVVSFSNGGTTRAYPLRILGWHEIANDSPSIGMVADAIRNAGNPAAAALAFWISGGIAHREVAARQMAMLALKYLKHAPREIGAPLIAARLNDGDPLFRAMCLKLLERWTDMDYGVLLSDAVPLENESTGLKEFRPGSEEKVLAAVGRANRWWAEHASEFDPVDVRVPEPVHSSVAAVPAPDFALKPLDGGDVRLSAFRGKVVLINFRTTRCTACVGERNDVGGPFNGGELPATVIVDREGNVRRRFVGARPLPVFDAMIEEAMSPANRD